MASLISDSEKSTLNSVMEDQADTFSRAVTIIKDPIKTVSTPSSSFNSIYGNAGATTSVTYTEQSSTIQARIEYGMQMDEDYFSSSKSPNQLKVTIPEGLVRMKIKAADYDTVSDAKRVEFDNQKFSIYSDFRGHGLFDTQYYTVMLKKIS
mgnify:CR=1 FL=1|jgi:hypothetical protein|tara:strand:+ start:1452 stop:1904 length:453 start_codon:yes stop_codon:yes gene_type:complete